ncbi:Unknown protein [Striga hermonthica]|uniref:GRF zinc finger containing protein n=1 Tax=Striga hermonthica TaxID=68872 RepID=A0A9N7N926_STRHE|nr:Unknown protein [Striga hermonthica]
MAEEVIWRQTSEVTLDKYCRCGKKTVMITSWTDNNPGRRFATSKRNGCKYYVWIDPPMCTRAQKIIPGLKRRLDEAEAELASKRKRARKMWFALVASWIILYFFSEKMK